MKLISYLRVLLPLAGIACAATLDAPAAPPACAPDQVVTRKEWGDLPPADRKAYTDAVLCLQSQPSQLSHSLYNTTSRYEDFTAVHINQTRLIHFNGVFLAWHRGFIRLFESALQTECGYVGALPYWDWIKHHDNITASPLFDGSPFSLSGQGLPLTPEEKEKEPPCWQIGTAITCPKGPGGGCATDGPFKNYTIGFLPTDPNAITNPEPGLPPNVFNYQPRCFARDISQYIATNFQTPENLDNLLSTTSIKDFQDALDNVSGFPGLHAAGHFAVGAVGGDIFSSPTEPAFYLHHAMIDKVWSQWQSVHTSRVFGDNAIFGTLTSQNIPPSANATFHTVINWGQFGEPRALRELMAVGRGEMCFQYD
ncbi:Di-copper centre-containing protein [Auricularia subglabra TFB-10046 SS5]|nr:Di-copper centre-containing protein [Auricularia subglabra TFB-10046 SS5]